MKRTLLLLLGLALFGSASAQTVDASIRTVAILSLIGDTMTIDTYRPRVGSGHLRGIGFYIDRYLGTKNPDTGETAHGFIAPYVHIRLTLVDLSTLEMRGEQTIGASETWSASGNEKGFDPWGSITPEQKVASLKRLIETHVAAAVPLLVRSKAP